MLSKPFQPSPWDVSNYPLAYVMKLRLSSANFGADNMVKEGRKHEACFFSKLFDYRGKRLKIRILGMKEYPKRKGCYPKGCLMADWGW